jgi:hypothetical protein
MLRIATKKRARAPEEPAAAADAAAARPAGKAPRAAPPAAAAAPSAPAPNGFAQAMQKVLSRELHVGSTAGAVLAKRHTAAEKAEAAARALAKALRVRSASRHARVVERNALPSALSGDAERDLRRMATKGVIALFNAVAKHQHATQVALAEPAERTARAHKVGAAQASFLDLLRDTTRAAAEGGAGSGGGAALAAAAAAAAAAPAAAPAAAGAAGKKAKGSGAAWMTEDFVERAGNQRGRRAAAEAIERHNEAGGAAPPAKGARKGASHLDVEEDF